MADQELTNILANLVRQNASSRLPSMRQVSGLSNALLASTPLQNPYNSNAPKTKDSRGPSLVNRVLDVMSRPLYTVLNPINEAIKAGTENFDNPENYATSVAGELVDPSNYWAGLSGQSKTTGRDILDSTGLAENLPGPAKFAAGMAIDVVADPLTYVGGLGLASKLGKGAKTSVDALKAVEEGTARSAQSLADEISRRAARQASDLYETPVKAPEAVPALPMGSLPGIARKQAPEPVESLSAADNNISKTGFDLEQQYENGNLVRGTLEELVAKGKNEPTPLVYGPSGEVIIRGKKATSPVPQRGSSAADDLADDLAVSDTVVSERLVNKILELNKKLSESKNPAAKGAIRKDLDELSEDAMPADIFAAARKVVPEFPPVTVNQRWVDEAKQVAQRFLKNNRNKDINHIGQSNLYNSILSAASKVRKDRRAFHVMQMLRVAEDELLAAGKTLTDAEGLSARLTDIANVMGGPRGLNTRLVDDFRKAKPTQAVEDVKAYNAPQVASEIIDPVVKTAEDVAPQVKTLPDSQIPKAASEISQALTRLSRSAGASAREAKTAKNFIDDLFKIERDPLYSKIEQEARNLVRQSMSNRLEPDLLHRISNDVYKSLGVNPKILGREVNQSRVVEGIMTKFATWWGAKDLKPFSREYIDTARNVAAAFSETLTPIVRSTKPSQREAAWSVATGKRSAITGQEQQLADQFRYMIERLMGTHGITNNAEAVVLRSGTLLKELNDELPQALKLIDGKGTDALGRSFDYRDGNWMHSWKEWNVKDPAEALYQLTRALQMVTRKNAMWDDAAVRWGLPVKSAEYQYKVSGIPRLSGTYFPKQIADQLNNLGRQLERDVFKSPHKAVDVFDKVQRMWKTGVTIYSPSHHIRNLNGDVFLAALDGVVSPRPYYLASKVMHAYPTRYKDLESVFNIMDPRMREAALRARPGNVVVKTKNGYTLTAEQLYQLAESNGLFVRAIDAEELVGGAVKFKPFGGRVNSVASRATELRDHWVRMAHFIDILQKSKSSLPVAIEQAVRRVKKFHPDGTDLTGFEQNVLRRIIPFYSWMRKATPLVFEGAVMRPHISLAFPKVEANMQLATGIESEGPGDPFPVDQMFPEWIREKGIGPILQPGSGLGRDQTWRGDAPGYTVVNPTNPFMDQTIAAGSPGKTLLSSLTPGARIPIELLTGQTSLGIPLEAVEGGTPGHLAQQIPSVGIGMRLTGATRDNEPWNAEQLLNWLTSAGITGTGPYQYQAQSEIREMLRRIGQENRGDYR